MYSDERLLIFLLPRWLLYINDTMTLTNPSIPMIDVGTPNGITNAPQQNWWFFTRSVVTTMYSLKLLSSISVKYQPAYINFHGNVNTISYGEVKIYHNKSSHFSVEIFSYLNWSVYICFWEPSLVQLWKIYIDKPLQCIIITKKQWPHA